MAASGIGLAMKYFGKAPNQTLSEFRDEWNKLSDESKEEITQGLTPDKSGNVSETYPDR